MKKRSPVLAALSAAILFTAVPLQAQAQEILNASYDVAREFYKEYNPLFEKHWQAKNGGKLTIKQSHGGSSKQARSVAEGMEADVVTLNQDNDIDFLVDSGVVEKDWKKKFKHGAAPFSSTVVFLVRKGNPKQIKDWNDLVKPGLQVIIPNPKTSGNGRYTYLAAWTYAKHQLKGGNDTTARNFVQRLFKNVPVLDAGGRGATTTFVQRGIGDVLITFENEVYLTQKELGADKVDIVYPSSSIQADLPVAVVDKYAKKHGTQAVATEYLNYLYSPAGQAVAVKYFLRPSDQKLLKANAKTFKPIKLYSVDKEFGGWVAVQKAHFNDGGIFDQLYVNK